MRTQGSTPYAIQHFIATFKPRLYLVGDTKRDTFVQINKDVSVDTRRSFAWRDNIKTH